MRNNFTTEALPRLRLSHKTKARVPARIIPLAYLTPNNKYNIWFSHGTFHSIASTITLRLSSHNITTVQITTSQISIPLSVTLH